MLVDCDRDKKKGGAAGRGRETKGNLRGRGIVLNNNPDARVGADVPDIRLHRERQVAGVGHQQGRGVVIDAAADAVKTPKSVTRCVLEQLHAKGVRAGRRRWLHLVHGGCDGQVVVGTSPWVRDVPGL